MKESADAFVLSSTTFKGWLLNEMFVHKLSSEPKIVIAFRGDIWLLDNGTPESKLNKIWNAIKKQHPVYKKMKKSKSYDKTGFNLMTGEHEKEYDPAGINSDFTDSYDLMNHISDYIADAVAGTIWKNTLFINSLPNINITTSPLAKKVSQELGVTLGRMALRPSGDEQEIILRKKQILGNLPDAMYHGTTSEYLYNILKHGLVPGESDSNYKKQNVWHPDKIFLTADFNNAEYHANNVTRSNNFPVVIKVKIPDQSKIVPDYDADKQATGTSTYALGRASTGAFYSVPPAKTIKHSGNIGYKGRIPASFITEIYISQTGSDDWKKLTGKRIITLKNRLNDIGNDAFYYYGLNS